MHATIPAGAPMPNPRHILSRRQVREVDRIAIEELGIPGIVLMENAAIALANAAIVLIDQHGLNRVALVSGPGNNGGDGFALARQLHNRLAGREIEISVVLAAGREQYRGDAKINLEIAEQMGLVPEDPDIERVLEALTEEELTHRAGAGRTLVVDALLGTGATRPPDGAIAGFVRWINHAHEIGAHVLAVDLPTGLDGDTGAPLGSSDLVVRADVTVTLCAMKPGLEMDGARDFVGEVIVGDIGVPHEIIERCAAM